MARYFDGSTFKVSVADASEIRVAAGDFTVACWFIADVFSGYKTLFSKAAGSGTRELSVYIQNGTDIYYGVGFGTAYAGCSPTWKLNQWQHFCMTRTGSAVKIYNNGVQCSAFTEAGTSTGTTALEIGSGVDGLAKWSGKIAEFGLWNTHTRPNDIVRLAKGAGALDVNAGALVRYLPLWGTNSPETELVRGGVGTVTGATAFPHPRIGKVENHLLRRFSSRDAAIASVAAAPTRKRLAMLGVA